MKFRVKIEEQKLIKLAISSANFDIFLKARYEVNNKYKETHQETYQKKIQTLVKHQSKKLPVNFHVKGKREFYHQSNLLTIEYV